MYGTVVAAVVIEIVGLLAMIRKRLAGHLTSGDSPAVSERGQKQSVDTVPLEDIEHGLCAFVHKRYSTNLDADHLFSARLRLGLRSGHRGGCCCDKSCHQEITPIAHGTQKIYFSASCM